MLTKTFGPYKAETISFKEDKWIKALAVAQLLSNQEMSFTSKILFEF